ncbi:hypothetical protein CBS147339_8462 [Penicillium roqueforti]|nr:hypothetical protein DTO012A8_8219 [Penicillium roqueforti]KAI3067507.1 hypothetical protein CBS147339_8462 [Penicillium roqueforti]KAI3089210.1 hypothetical protein CBS147338_9722 [Penicillium roqueforti]KAI3129963.1 hypothetical protein CBS147325_9482 [Penicillium roqueforti]KAI3152934.1 hypothetical protein DTO046C5_8854 [Penicillium roqueforti]
MARDRAGTLSVINMSFLFLAHHLGFLANAMGVSLMACKRIHRAVGWMTGILLGLHIIMAMITDRKSWILREKPNLFALIGSVIIAAILLSSFPFIRRFLYEPFLRLHQALATACIYSIWRHLPSGALLPRLYVYIPLGIMLLALLVELFLFIVRNGVFPPRPYSRASIRCDRVQQTPIQSKEATPLKVRIALTRPLHIQAGQYISLWIPAASLFSWAQTHPFMVTSWSPEKQDVLELFVQPRRGLTETIHHRTALDGYTSLTAFVGGPYGVSKSVDHYECVLAIATDFGIAGVISYLKKLLYGYNTCTSHVRRVHFVWEIQTLDIAVAAQPLLNSLLSDDILDDGYILEMSFFVASNQMIEHGKPFGQHRRATVFNGKPRTRIMVSFDPDTLVSHGAPGPDISDDDLVDWDTWLTPEALHNEKYLATSQCSFINMGSCTERQHLLKHAPQLHSNQPEVPLPSDGSLQLTQSTDGNKETMTIGLQTSSAGVYAFAKCGNTEIQPIVINEKEQLKYSKPSEDNYSLFGLGNHHQRRALISPDLKLLKVQEIERETFHKYKPVDNRTQAAEYVDCIQRICQIATGETMSVKQARDVEDCGDSLITIIRSDGPIASFKSLLLNCHLYTLPRVDLNSSLAACVSYLRYLNSLTSSISKSDDMNRRLAQIWIHIHFENHVNDLKESEKNGLPLNRQRRAIPTIARDSILQAFHGNQFVPQKTDRDYLSDQCRWGERWWKAATCMGLGVILLASEDLANQIGRRTAFQNKMVDTLAIYVLNRYPALTSLYRSFESMAVDLMLGGDIVSSQDQLNLIQEAPVENEANSCKLERWVVPNLNSLSRIASSHLIFLQGF